MSREEFIQEVADYAVADYEVHKILPSVTIAQAILESAWGESTLATKANALFGIKATTSWKGETYTVNTWEEINGKRVQTRALFRAYEDWEQSVIDHGEFLAKLSRYANIIGNINYENVCKLLHTDGYATDSNYPAKLISLIRGYNLDRYDTVAYFYSQESVPKEDGRTVYYAIQRGDTLDRIAFMHYTSVNNLVRLNNIKNPNLIYAGQKIRLN